MDFITGNIEETQKKKEKSFEVCEKAMAQDLRAYIIKGAQREELKKILHKWSKLVIDNEKLIDASLKFSQWLEKEKEKYGLD